MKTIIWKKEDIKHITDEQIAMWFDIYNNDLFEDRGYDITHMDLKEIDDLYLKLKTEYEKYLASLEFDETFIFYIILVDEFDKFISQARLILKDNKLVIEGLETHRDLLRCGNATKLLTELEKVAKISGYDVIYANSYSLNYPSIKTFEGLNYDKVESSISSRVCMKKNLV